MSDDELTKKYNSLYLEMLMRYREKIEEGEKLYIAELPKLVTPSDDAVVAAVNKIKSAFPSYSSDENFKEAAAKALSFINDSIVQVSAPIQFWLRPNQVLSIGAGDVFDQMVLLCSMLIGLGNMSSKVIATMKNEGKAYAVYCEFQGKVLVLERGRGISELKDKNELLAKMGIYMGSDSTGYEFNDKMYADLP